MINQTGDQIGNQVGDQIGDQIDGEVGDGRKWRQNVGDHEQAALAAVLIKRQTPERR